MAARTLNYHVYKTDGTIETLQLKSPMKLAQLQELVGGYIEMVYFKGGLTGVVNEEGYLLDLPRNPHFDADQFENAFAGGYVRGNLVEGLIE